MNPTVGWALSGAALLAGWFGYGWRGIVLALSVIVFWLLLQFSRTLRVLRLAATRPVGSVDNAVMLNARLDTRLRLIDVLRLTGSLGRRVSETPERWAWADGAGDEVEIEFAAGRCASWQLKRAGPAQQT
jgi:hypothetical protein